jgi:hypothetical protein
MANNDTAVNIAGFAERTQFHKLIAQNPNYFGNFAGSEFQPIFPLKYDTNFEELTCIGFNPDRNLLEAVIQVKQPTGYSGGDCSPGSFEYIRFFVDYGSGFQDAGLAAINVHDVPGERDCAKDSEKPLSYSASVRITPPSNNCRRPELPKVRAILSWNSIPPAGNPNWTPVWGNHFDGHIQIKPSQLTLGNIFDDIADSLQVKLTLPAEYATVAKFPIPLPDPPPFNLAGLMKLYGDVGAPDTSKAGVQSVPAHRFAFPEVHSIVSAPQVSSFAVASKIADFKNVGLDWQAVLGALAEVNADVSFEQLECLALEGNAGLERLVATFRIKRPTGYAGNLCSQGSLEYIAFWADWDDLCQYSYLGTVKIPVHDISTIPADGLSYAAVLPVDVSQHRGPCDKPRIARVRAVLSWAAPPSTIDPNVLTTWGNRIDTHVQIQPGRVPNPLNPSISILGGIPTSQITNFGGLGGGVTTHNARFAGNNLLADNLGRQCPFGGVVEFQGPEFPGYKYRIQVRNLTAGGTFQDVAAPLMLTRANGTTYLSNPDASNFFVYQQYPDNIENLLGNWSSSGDDQWEVKLEIADLADNPVPGAIPYTHVIQLDNTAPQADIHIDSGGDCGKYAVGSILHGHFVAMDANFGSYSLSILPGTAVPPVVTPTGSSVETGTFPGDDQWTLTTTAATTPCGYVVYLWVADLSIVNSSWGAHNFAPASVGFCLLAKL